MATLLFLLTNQTNQNAFQDLVDHHWRDLFCVCVFFFSREAGVLLRPNAEVCPHDPSRVVAGVKWTKQQDQIFLGERKKVKETAETLPPFNPALFRNHAKPPHAPPPPHRW